MRINTLRKYARKLPIARLLVNYHAAVIEAAGITATRLIVETDINFHSKMTLFTLALSSWFRKELIHMLIATVPDTTPPKQN